MAAPKWKADDFLRIARFASDSSMTCFDLTIIALNGLDDDIAYQAALAGQAILLRQVKHGLFHHGLGANVGRAFHNGHNAVAAGTHAAAPIVDADVEKVGGFPNGGFPVNFNYLATGNKSYFGHEKSTLF